MNENTTPPSDQPVSGQPVPPSAPTPTPSYDQAVYQNPQQPAPSYGHTVPTPPYEQTPQQNIPSYGQAQPQTTDPYGQTPPQAATPYGQIPPQAAAPYGQNPYNQAYQQNVPPTYSQPAPFYSAPQTPQPPKKKIWPWILLACVMGVLFIFAVSAACFSLYSTAINTYSNSSHRTPHSYGYDYDSDGDRLGTSPFDNNNSSSGDTYTLKEIEDLAKDAPSTTKDGECTTGVFVVGRDIQPGLYYLEGNQTTEGKFLIFTKNETDPDYTLASNVYYFGNYFADLKDGAVILFLSPSDAHFYPASDSAYKTSTPVESGCYRVGLDVPAGTYRVTYQKNLPTDASQEAGVYRMKDILFNNDSIIEYYFLIAGGSRTITLNEGEYVELYGATMTKTSSSSQDHDAYENHSTPWDHNAYQDHDVYKSHNNTSWDHDTYWDHSHDNTYEEHNTHRNHDTHGNHH